MIYAVTIALAAALLAVVVLFLRNQRAAEAAWAEERRELLNRVQRPEMVPVAPAPQFKAPDREPDEYSKVGTIEISDDYGLED